MSEVPGNVHTATSGREPAKGKWHDVPHQLGKHARAALKALSFGKKAQRQEGQLAPNPLDAFHALAALPSDAAASPRPSRVPILRTAPHEDPHPAPSREFGRTSLKTPPEAVRTHAAIPLAPEPSGSYPLRSQEAMPAASGQSAPPVRTHDALPFPTDPSSAANRAQIESSPAVKISPRAPSRTTPLGETLPHVAAGVSSKQLQAYLHQFPKLSAQEIVDLLEKMQKEQPGDSAENVLREVNAAAAQIEEEKRQYKLPADVEDEVQDIGIHMNDYKREHPLLLTDIDLTTAVEQFAQKYPDIAAQFHGHGIHGKMQVRRLYALLMHGIDPKRTLYTAPLYNARAGHTSGSGGGPYTDGEFLVIGAPGQHLAASGIRIVVVDESAYDTLPLMQGRFPRIKFIRADHLSEELLAYYTQSGQHS